MLRLTRDDLLHIAPRPKLAARQTIWDGYVSAILSAEGASFFDLYKVNTPRRVRHALAQWAGAETGSFSILYESGAYTAAGILRVFGAKKHSSPVSPEEAEHIASLPIGPDGDGPRAQALFERVYGHLTHVGHELGNTQQGDGYRFRGVGPNQDTGREARTHACAKIGCTFDDYVHPLNLLRGALIEWNEKGCNAYADRDDAVSIRKLINAGTVNVSISKINGLPETMRALKAAEAVITDDDAQTRIAVAAPVEDVPGDNAPWPNNNQPVSLMSSTEMQAGAVGTSVTGSAAASEWAQAGSRIIQAATAEGRFSMSAFLFAALSEPLLLGALLATAATGGIIYMMIKRFKRFHIFGV